MKKLILIIIAVFTINIANAQWQQLSPSTTTSGGPTCMVSSDSVLYVGTTYGIFVTSNIGISWTHYTIRGTILSIAAYGSNVIASTIQYDTILINVNYVYYSTNYGQTWDSITFDTPLNSSTSHHSLVTNYNNIFYVSRGNNLFRSDNNFSTWSQLTNPSTQYINRLKVSNTGAIFTGEHLAGLHKSTNGGLTWTNINTPFQTIGINCVLNIENDTIYCSPTYSLYKTVNNGLNWVLLPDSIWFSNNLNALGFLKVGNTLFVGQHQIYQSNDFGNNWDSIYSGPVYYSSFSPLYVYNNYLYACYYFPSTSNNNLGLSRAPLCSFITSFPNNNIISGSYNVCKGQQNVTYTLPPITYAQSYQWTLPNGFTGTSTSNRTTLNIDTNAISGIIKVKGFNGCIYSDSSVYYVNVSSLPVPNNSGTISGLTNVCQGQNSVTYTVPTIANATSYTWSLPYGVTGTSTSNTITLHYNDTAQTGNITVKGINSCGISGNTSSLPIIVNQLPANASSLSGQSQVCHQNSLYYFTTPISNATSYIWTLTNGATGTSTSTGILINYTNTAVSGNITVKGHNACGDGTPKSLPIIVNADPSPAGTITGTINVCKGQHAVTYTVPAITNASMYEWTLPNGFNGSSNNNSITLNIDTNATSGFIKVKGFNNCSYGDTSVLYVNVKTIPITQGLITGSPLVNQGQHNVLYSITPSAGADSYIWSLPLGAFGNSVTNSINVNYSSIVHTGIIKVKAHNTCGDGSYTSLAISVQNSLGYNVKNNNICLYPNPASNFYTITYTLLHNQLFNLSIYDITGRKISELINSNQQSGQHHLTLDATELKEGIYFLKAEGVEDFDIIKFSVMH